MSEPSAGSAYERRFAELSAASHAIAYGFARHALRGILRGIGFVPGDRVVLAPLTCRVVVLALLAERAEIAYVDIRRESLNLDPELLRSALAQRTQAVLFQHTYGGRAGLDECAAIARAAGVALIEDRAQCLPRALPLRGIAAIYSNNLRKPLPAAAGGLAITNDAALAAALRLDAGRLPLPNRIARLRLATEARLQQLLLPRFYWPLNELARRKSPTYRNASLAEEIASEIDATALGVSAAQERAGLRWLRRAPALDALRQAGTSRYAAALGESGASFAVPPQVRTGALYYFPVLTEHKAQLLAEAERRNLELVAWPVATPIFPIEREEFLPKYRYRPGSCPVAERVARELVGLPTDGRAPPNDLIELVLRHGTTK